MMKPYLSRRQSLSHVLLSGSLAAVKCSSVNGKVWVFNPDGSELRIHFNARDEGQDEVVGGGRFDARGVDSSGNDFSARGPIDCLHVQIDGKNAIISGVVEEAEGVSPMFIELDDTVVGAMIDNGEDPNSSPDKFVAVFNDGIQRNCQDYFIANDDLFLVGSGTPETPLAEMNEDDNIQVHN